MHLRLEHGPSTSFLKWLRSNHLIVPQKGHDIREGFMSICIPKPRQQLGHTPYFHNLHAPELWLPAHLLGTQERKKATGFVLLGAP